MKLDLSELASVVRAMSRQEYFRSLREPEKSQVIDNFYAILSHTDPTINASTGVSHTVESMVTDLRERVGLDLIINKTSADEAAVHLSPAASDDELKQLAKTLKDFAIKNYLERDHGMSSLESVIEGFKSEPGGMDAITNFGRDRIRDILRDILDKFPKDDMAPSLPELDHVTLPAADGQLNNGEPANVGVAGAPGVTAR